MVWNQLMVPVTSGVTVATIIAVVRMLWRRTQLPSGLSRRVTRRNYLASILAISRDAQVDRLEAMVPNLVPAGGSQVLGDIQRSWETLNSRRGARIVTREEPDSLIAGAELLSKGIEVRVSRSMAPDHISYHVFSGEAQYTVLNRRQAGQDRPERLDGVSPSKVFHSHFEQVWNSSAPLESLLAEQVLAGQEPTDGGPEFADRLRELRARYRLDDKAEDAVLRHLAFRHRAPVIFITGLPGAGKSLVRRRLAKKLADLRFQVDEQSDYVYAFEDFLHSLMRLGDGRGTGFTAEIGGAFQVEREENLRPALHALGQRVWANRLGTPLTLVEFARSNVVAALRVFGDEVLSASQVIHVQASDAVRAARLEARGQPPRISVAGQSISLVVSDDHRLPSSAAESLYRTDDVVRLKAQKVLEGRVHVLDNNADTAVRQHIDEDLDGFIEAVVRPYRAMVA
jgi:hypothetical protein